MKERNQNCDPYRSRRRLFSGISLAVFLILSLLLTLLFTKILAPYLKSTEQLRAFLDSYGWKGRFILLGVQCLQVVVALIPGEVIELGAGYAYGAVEGTLLCLLGIAISSSVVFLLTKKLGSPMVETFISREKLNQHRFFNSEEKRKRLLFLLFFIPGTPKDVFTYIAGLTPITLPQFLSITLIARIPSVLSSTISGQMLGDKDYITAIIVYAITAILSAGGYLIYQKLIKQRQKEKR